MIGKLTGILDSAQENFLILDVQGVGYQVHCSSATLSRCGQTGDPLSLLIEMQVREDAITLYGFLSAAEQEWFKLLTSVQGVGAKAGMAILTVNPPEQLGFAIASGDKAAIQRADGVGPKLAARILTELKDKATKIDLAAKPKGVSMPAGANDSAASTPSMGPEQDAVSALINLGYQRADAYAAVVQAKEKADNDNLDVSEMIKLALKELA
ncbi:MAG: Holliday junction branch migration protein RuvA [Pseudomonadota bacterium]